MTKSDAKTEKCLSFDIGSPISMFFGFGKRGITTDVGESSSASLSFSITAHKPSSSTGSIIWVLSTDDFVGPAELAFRASEKTGTKKIQQKKLSEFNGTLHIRKTNNAKENASLGSLSYYGEGYELTIYLPEQDFDQLRALFVRGNSPIVISVWTPEIEYGIEIDKVWNISSTPYINNIVGVDIGCSVEPTRIMVGAKRTEDEEEQATKEDKKLKQAVLESRQDIQLLCYQLADIKETLGKLHRESIRRIIVMAVVLAALLMWQFKPH